MNTGVMISDQDFLLSLNEARPIHPPKNKISEYVEGHRVLPSETPFPGPWRNEVSPHTVEIMDNMSPFSPVIAKTSLCWFFSSKIFILVIIE